LTRGTVIWLCSAIYASPTSQLREELWNHLVDMRSSVIDPWMLIGETSMRCSFLLK
jgi:hypothetical protein